MGLIAQDVLKVIPKTISKGADAYLQFGMNLVNVAMIHAFRELKAENDMLKAVNGKQQTRTESLESRLSRLEDLVSATSAK